LKLKEADKKEKEYEAKNILQILKKSAEKNALLLDLEARETEYQTLTASFSDVEQQFKTLVNSLENEKKEFENLLMAQGLKSEKKYQENKSALKAEEHQEAEKIKEKFRTETDLLKEAIHNKETSGRDLSYREKEIRAAKY